MKNRLSHFAIYTDDIAKAKNFYDNVFDWGFNSYGPEDFLQIKDDKSAEGKLIGALQSRKYSPLPERINGLECTIAVDNIDEIIKRVKKNEGKIIMPKTEIPHVGWITKFLDTDGNILCAMQYNLDKK